MSQHLQKTKKNKYSKPQLRTIELVAEEVLVAGCKTATGSIAFGQPGCGITNNCASAGS